MERLSSELRGALAAYSEEQARSAGLEEALQNAKVAEAAACEEGSFALAEAEKRIEAAGESKEAEHRAREEVEAKLEAQVQAVAVAEAAAAEASDAMGQRRDALEATSVELSASRLLVEQLELREAQLLQRVVDAEDARAAAAAEAATAAEAVVAGATRDAVRVAAGKEEEEDEAAAAEGLAAMAVVREELRVELSAVKARAASLEAELQQAHRTAAESNRTATPGTTSKRARVYPGGGPVEEPSWLQRSLSRVGIGRGEGSLPIVDPKSQPVSKGASRRMFMLLYVVLVHGLLLFNVASHLHHHE